MVNLPIQEGFSIATGQGRAEIEFESGATARLAENSVLQFTQLALSDGGRITRLTLTQGTASFYANLTSQDNFVVLTPTLQVSIPKKASFRVDTSDAGATVSVLKGEVSVDSEAGSQRVTKGHTLSFDASNANDVEIRRNAEADQWDRWVTDRDEVIRTGDSATLRYVNSPYTYGLADLYSYGGWYNYAGYGRCWQPWGVGFGWSPFWNGRWAFFPGLGWTWISFEPWGWMPYHFGSWVFSPAAGWLWVPGVFHQWQPARVNWVRVGNQTAWVPVHPQDQIGHTPANLQHGVVTTSGGSMGFRGTNPLVRKQIGKEVELHVLPAPPAGFAGGGQAASNPRGFSGRPGPTPVNLPGIVFDPRDRRFVNNPAAPNRKIRDKDKAVEIDPNQIPPHRGSSGTAPPAPQTPPAPGAPAGARGPSGTGGPAPVAPHVQPPRTPPPPPAPAPHVDRPRGQSESPRPASPPPAPRSEFRAPRSEARTSGSPRAR